MEGGSMLGDYTILNTGDGSPSLRGEVEPMHHLGGAYTETQYLYGDALRYQLGLLEEQFSKCVENKTNQKWKVLIIGLGLGYIEILSVLESLKNKKKLHLVSYEIKQELVDYFLNWLKGSSDHPVYDKMMSFFQRDYSDVISNTQVIKDHLLKMYEKGEWVIKGELNEGSLPGETFNAILFDAFSGKSTPDLWTEAFLISFLKKATESQSVFSTYACTGILKRSLMSVGYRVEKKAGFMGKRHSTFAIKNQINDCDHEII